MLSVWNKPRKMSFGVYFLEKKKRKNLKVSDKYIKPTTFCQTYQR